MRSVTPQEDWHRADDALYHHQRDIFRFPAFEDMMDFFFGGYFHWH